MMLGKPMRMIEFWDGDIGFELRFKWGKGLEKAGSEFYILPSPRMQQTVRDAIAKGLYVQLDYSCTDVKYIGDKLASSVRIIEPRSVDWVKEHFPWLIVNGYSASKTTSGVYRVNL